MVEDAEPTRTSAGGPAPRMSPLQDLAARFVPAAEPNASPAADETVQTAATAPGGVDSTEPRAPTSAPPAIGAGMGSSPYPRVGPYDLLEKIGAGGMGVVYLARQRGLDRPVALKVIQDLGGGNADDRVRRFHREAQAAARLSHPGIVPVFDIGEEGGVHYYSMEYVLGRSLAEVLQQDRPSPRRSLEIVAAVARALAYAHHEGVIHRDIKPPNILLTPDGRPRIMDFGIAKDRSKESLLTQEGAALGTPTYMPPEQAMGQLGRVDARSDVYSLGAVLYQMLAGRPPFTGSTPIEVVVKVLQQAPAPVRSLAPAVHVDLETICMKCLEKEPERRYRSAEDLADDIDRFLQGSPIHAKPLSAWGRMARGIRRRWRVAAGAAAFVLAIGGIALYHERAEIDALERLRVVRDAGAALGAGALEPPERWPEVLARVRALLDPVLAAEPGHREGRLRRAEVALLAGDWLGAAADLDTVLAADPNDERALYLWARCGDALRDVDEESRYPELAARASGHRERLAAREGPLARIAQIQVRQRDGLLAESVAAVDTLLAEGTVPEPIDLQQLSLAAHVDLGDLETEELGRRAEALIRADPRRPASWRLRHRLWDRSARDEDAARDLATCIALQPRPARADLRAHYLLLESLFPAADAPERRAALDRLAEVHPDDAQGWMWRAELELQAGRLAAAEEALRKGAALSRRPLDLAGSFWVLRRRSQGREAADAELDSRLQQHPPAEVVREHGGTALTALLDRLIAEGEFARAESILRLGADVRPDDPHLIAAAADLAFETGRNRDAVREFDRLIAARPAESELYSKRARVHRRLGDLPAAVADMQKAVSLKGWNTKNRLQLGVLLMLTGQGPKAIDEFVEVLYRTPTLKLERRMQRWAQGDFTEDGADEPAPTPKVDPEKVLAGSLVRKVLPRIGRRLLERGGEALRAGDEARAEQCFAAACIGLPDWPEPYVWMARIQARRKSWFAATLCLERAAQHGYRGFAGLAREADLAPLLEFPRVRRLLEADAEEREK